MYVDYYILLSNTLQRLFILNEHKTIKICCRILAEELIMFEDEFQKRLYELRNQKKVSARDMSLSIGQTAGYISRIENGWGLPSMSAFLFICDYLNITPSEFFDTEVENPEKIRQAVNGLKKLDSVALDHVLGIIELLAK